MCGGLFAIIKELKVENIIIGKQFEEVENLQKFLEIVKERRIKVITVEAGDKINIEKNLYFQVLWPNSSNIVSENLINNNALVCKLNFKNFTMLFTGDIEEKAESQILKLYSKNQNLLKSTVLKITHHGSKSSSTEEFLKVVDPKFALIGVGKNNLFGHPNDEIIERLKNHGIKIYRTDENGEIRINTNGKSNKINSIK